MQWGALIALVGTFAALLILERRVHQRMQQVLFRSTGNPTLATVLYALVLLPGVALHELSHVLAARLLGVRVRKLSLRPERLRGGVVRFGYVEVLRSDDLRAALIGLAPLATGIAALALVGTHVFGLDQTWRALMTTDEPTEAVLHIARWVIALAQAPDAWLWLYAAFAIANTMLPSASDLQPWSSNPLLMLALVGAAALALNAIIALPWAYWFALLFAFAALVNAAALVMLSLLSRLLDALPR